MHLVVRDAGGEIVGACRVRVPDEAQRCNGYRLEGKFDLAMLAVLRERMVEVTGVRIHPEHRAESVIPRLGSEIARFLIDSGHDYVIASACVSVADGGHAAASLYRGACDRALSPEDYRVYPRRRLAVEALRDTLHAPSPPLLKGYLDLGAWICGEPAWDPDFVCADIPVLLPLARMRAMHARQFLAHAA
jgi:putative hemolysin